MRETCTSSPSATSRLARVMSRPPPSPHAKACALGMHEWPHAAESGKRPLPQSTACPCRRVLSRCWLWRTTRSSATAVRSPSPAVAPSRPTSATGGSRPRASTAASAASAASAPPAASSTGCMHPIQSKSSDASSPPARRTPSTRRKSVSARSASAAEGGEGGGGGGAKAAAASGGSCTAAASTKRSSWARMGLAAPHPTPRGPHVRRRASGPT